MATTTTTTIQEEEEKYGPTFDYAKAMDEYKVGQKPILDAIMSNYKKPEPEIDPEQARKAKFGAAMTDTFGSLAEMFAHGQGALVQKRDTPSSTQTTNAKLQALKDKYDKDMLQYGATKSNAELQDLNMYLQNARDAAGKKREYSLYKAKAAQEAEKERLRAMEKAEDRKIKAKQHADNLRLGYAKLKDEEEDKIKTVPVFINNKQQEFRADLMEEVVARAIKDGVAGKTTVEVTDKRGNKSKQSVPVQLNTPLSVQQKQQIFQNVYPKYILQKQDGSMHIRRNLSEHDKQSGVTAQEKYLKPKQAAKPTVKQSNFSLNGVKSR